MNFKPYINYLIVGVAIVIGFVLHAFIISQPKTAHEYCFQEFYKTSSNIKGESRAEFLIGMCGNK